LGDQIKDERWRGHAAHMGEMKNAYRILVGTSKEESIWDTYGQGKIILKWILK
jgi:hypothetical protein